MKFLVIYLLIWLAACSSANDSSQAQTVTQNVKRPDCSRRIDSEVCGMELAIFDHVNDLRQEKELSTLLWNDSLAVAARQWSCKMGQQGGALSHLDWEARIRASGLPPGGENVAKLSGAPSQEKGETMFQMWKDSPEHFKNMIDERFEVIGIGICLNQKVLYGTQNFSFASNNETR